jgi:hypothetical protein
VEENLLDDTWGEHGRNGNFTHIGSKQPGRETVDNVKSHDRGTRAKLPMRLTN